MVRICLRLILSIIFSPAFGKNRRIICNDRALELGANSSFPASIFAITWWANTDGWTSFVELFMSSVVIFDSTAGGTILTTTKFPCCNWIRRAFVNTLRPAFDEEYKGRIGTGIIAASVVNFII